VAVEALPQVRVMVALALVVETMGVVALVVGIKLALG